MAFIFGYPRTARIIPDTKVHCRYCNAEIDMDSELIKRHYDLGDLGIICPSCGNFTRGDKS